MKTEDELLISFMYREGYTEEDMYDIEVLAAVRSSFGFRLMTSTYVLNERFSKLGQIIQEAMNNFKNALLGISPAFVEVLETGEMPKVTKRKQSFKVIDSKFHSHMSHQVDNRKPRHLVKKIIR